MVDRSLDVSCEYHHVHAQFLRYQILKIADRFSIELFETIRSVGGSQ